jgi:hypothetical protein
MNLYKEIGAPRRTTCCGPIKQVRSQVVLRPPRALLDVKLDGRRSDYFEWIAAGHYDMSREYSALAGESSFLSDVYYGFDQERLLLRLDFRKGVDGKRVPVRRRARPGRHPPRPVTVPLHGVIEDIFEGAVPFVDLGLKPGEDVEFFLEFERTPARRCGCPR